MLFRPKSRSGTCRGDDRKLPHLGSQQCKMCVKPSLAGLAYSFRGIPLAAVLWNGGISFGGAIAFVFADLIILPILNIYRKYYGKRMMLFMLATFYVAMAGAAFIVEAVFGSLAIIPQVRDARVVEASLSWDYTTWLNLVFLALAVLLIWRFVSTGGLEMLRMMNRPAMSRRQ
jgi:uncharacterized membrane protein YraQ (UPF0718 family)